MLKKILVATDASEYSRRALKTALELARKFNSEVELLFVMHLPLVYDSSVNSYVIAPEQLEQESNVVLKTTIDGLDISDVPFTKKKLQGKPAPVILKEAEHGEFDLIVLGSHGYSAIAGSLLGSVSQHVLHKAKCSVLIVK
jgi:nucleotide-binding universal stress UspA family protein